MMPRKSPETKRSYMIGVKIDQITKEKIEYLAEMENEKVSTYVFNLIKEQIAKKEPWISREIEEIKKGGN